MRRVPTADEWLARADVLGLRKAGSELVGPVLILCAGVRIDSMSPTGDRAPAVWAAGGAIPLATGRVPPNCSTMPAGAEGAELELPPGAGWLPLLDLAPPSRHRGPAAPQGPRTFCGRTGAAAEAAAVARAIDRDDTRPLSRNEAARLWQELLQAGEARDAAAREPAAPPPPPPVPPVPDRYRIPPRSTALPHAPPPCTWWRRLLGIRTCISRELAAQ